MTSAKGAEASTAAILKQRAAYTSLQKCFVRKRKDWDKARRNGGWGEREGGFVDILYVSYFIASATGDGSLKRKAGFLKRVKSRLTV